MKAPQATRNRQVVYSGVILGLFAVMFPYTSWLKGVKDDKDLGEARIGQIDSGNFLFKLAQLAGMRGIAANYLWSKAQNLQKAQDWDQLKTTVDFITQLQPHFLLVWSFQGWNLSYNVSVEWDAPEDKYEWIKQGIKFLQRGVEKNQKSSDLVWDTSWTYYHKIGFSDEAIVLRRLFRDDDDLKFKTPPQPGSNPLVDNFLLAHGWFSKAVDMVDSGQGERIEANVEAPVEYIDRVENRKGRPGDLHFRSMPGHALIRYAAGLEKRSVQGIEPQFGERARSEWQRAFDEWVKFGRHPFPMFRYEKEAVVRLDDLTVPARLAKLDAKGKYWTDRWGEQTHYPYWKDRCAAEKSAEGVRARRLFYEATDALRKAEFPRAVAKYREGLDLWKELLDRHAIYRDDELNKRDTGLIVKRYLRALENASMEKPKDVPFEKLLKNFELDTSPDPFDEMDMPAKYGDSRSGPAAPQ